MRELASLVGKLCAVSEHAYENPYAAIDWPDSVETDAHWFTSPELMSLFGTETFHKLSESEKRRLSFYEAVNFYSLNIHGEKPLVHGLADRIYRPDTLEISPYLHHFLDEENKHMVYFGGFCTRYAGKIYPNKKVVFAREFAEGEEDFLFFAKALIFEEIADAFNVRMSLDERLHPIARQINNMHHHDESRHLVFGRKVVSSLFARYKQKWSPETLEGVRQYLTDYFTATWREYYNPDVYKDAGVPEPYQAQKLAFACETQKSLRARISGGCIAYLKANQIIDKEPPL